VREISACDGTINTPDGFEKDKMGCFGLGRELIGPQPARGPLGGPDSASLGDVVEQASAFAYHQVGALIDHLELTRPK
jgi:hypothetical protein